MPPPLPQSIALHIGAHKTASSHLQNTLYRNRRMLAEEGIRVYGPGYLRMKGRNLAAMFGLSWSESPAPRRTPDAQLRFLAKGYKRLVFTEENFVGMVADRAGKVPLPLYPMAVERIAELVAAVAPIEPQLFLAVRNPTTYMASAYSQTLFKTPDIGPRTFRARNDWRKIDWADYVARLRAVPGLGEIFVWRQEDYAASQRLILRRMLRWKVGAKVEITEDRVHEGLSAPAVRQALIWAQEGREGELARDARHLFPAGPDNPRFRLYAASTERQAAEIYADQMQQIEAIEGVRVLHPPAEPMQDMAPNANKG